MKKIFITILIVMYIIMILSSTVLATNDIFAKGKDFIANGKNNTGSTLNTGKLKGTSGIIYNLLFGIGVATAVIVGAILGIQFMTAGIDKKVEVKEALLSYVISCSVFFGAFGIWKLLVTILNGIMSY